MLEHSIIETSLTIKSFQNEVYKTLSNKAPWKTYERSGSSNNGLKSIFTSTCFVVVLMSLNALKI
jgi:hypothetical protein